MAERPNLYNKIGLQMPKETYCCVFFPNAFCQAYWQKGLGHTAQDIWRHSNNTCEPCAVYSVSQLCSPSPHKWSRACVRAYMHIHVIHTSTMSYIRVQCDECDAYSSWQFCSPSAHRWSLPLMRIRTHTCHIYVHRATCLIYVYRPLPILLGNFVLPSHFTQLVACFRDQLGGWWYETFRL